MKHRLVFRWLAVTMALTLAMIGFGFNGVAARAEGIMALESMDAAQARMEAMYGENKPITDDNYDKSLAVKCPF